MSDRPSHAEVRDLLPELATGAASGEERARALQHIAGCSECRRELEELARVADEVLLLAPEREPPMGFETKVLSRLGPGTRHARGRGSFLYAAVVVLTAALAAGAALWATAEERDLGTRYKETLEVAEGKYFVAADLSSDGAELGHLFAYEGTPSWIFMAVEDVPFSGTFDVQLVTEDGRRTDIGDCVVSGGAGTWGRSIDVPVHDILFVRLVKTGAPPIVARFSDA